MIKTSYQEIIENPEQIARDHSALFEIAESLLRLAYEVIPFKYERSQTIISKPVERHVVALYAQAYRLFKSVIMLCKSGLGPESLILLRSLQETVGYLLYISEKDQEERLERYRHSTAMSACLRFNEFISAYPDLQDKLDGKSYDKIYREALNYFKNKHGKNITIQIIKEKYVLRPNEATASGFDKEMHRVNRLVHRHASSLSHGENVYEYIKMRGTPDTPKLVVGPTGKWIDQSVSDAIAYMFYAMERVDKLLIQNKNQQIETIKQKTFDLLRKYWPEDNSKQK
jgi:hypothetical protein